MSKEARAELLAALRQRYLAAPKAEKTKALDEFVAVAGCHRKHAIRLLGATDGHTPEPAPIDRRTYGEAVREALIVLWEAADRICGKRLQAVLPGLVEALERHGHLALDPAVREQLLAASAATIDRLLGPTRGHTPRRKRRKAAPQAQKQIPVRTFADWGDALPGSLEMDLVAHCGGSMQGNFLWTLVATDVCSGWTEAVPLLAREQSLVAGGLDAIRRPRKGRAGRAVGRHATPRPWDRSPADLLRTAPGLPGPCEGQPAATRAAWPRPSPGRRMVPEYATTDIYLAAFLCYRCMTLTSHKRLRPKKVEFRFAATPELHDLLRLYWSCELTPVAPADLFAVLHRLRCMSLTRS